MAFTEDPTIDPNIEIEFFDNGHLDYAIQTANGWQLMDLTWYVEGDVIVTDQPSDPHVNRTRFELTPDNTLVLTYGKFRSYYLRGPRRRPNGLES